MNSMRYRLQKLEHGSPAPIERDAAEEARIEKEAYAAMQPEDVGHLESAWLALDKAQCSSIGDAWDRKILTGEQNRAISRLARAAMGARYPELKGVPLRPSI